MILLKINSKDDTCLKVNGRSMKPVDVVCYLGDHFNHQGNNSDFCKDRLTKAPSSNYVPCAKGQTREISKLKVC